MPITHQATANKASDECQKLREITCKASDAVSKRNQTNAKTQGKDPVQHARRNIRRNQKKQQLNKGKTEFEHIRRYQEL